MSSMPDRFGKSIMLLLGLANGGLSSLISAYELPDPMAGFEKSAILVAVVAALVGTILGFKRFSREELQAIIVALIGLLVVPAIFFYQRILAKGGASSGQQLLGLFLYFYVFFAGVYLLTHLEIVFAAKIAAKPQVDK